MVSASVAPTYALSLEAFYQLDWAETEIDPVGSYFSSTDYAGPGATKAVLSNLMESLLPGKKLQQDRGFGFGPLTPVINADLAAARLPLQPQFDPNFASVLRGARPDSKGFRAVGSRVALPCRGSQPDRVRLSLPELSQPPPGRRCANGKLGKHPGRTCRSRRHKRRPEHSGCPFRPGVASALAIDRYAKSGKYFPRIPVRTSSSWASA